MGEELQRVVESSPEAELAEVSSSEEVEMEVVSESRRVRERRPRPPKKQAPRSDKRASPKANRIARGDSDILDAAVLEAQGTQRWADVKLIASRVLVATTIVVGLAFVCITSQSLPR